MGKYDLNLTVIAGNYTQKFEMRRKKSWTGRWKRSAERKFLLLPCLSRGFAMGKQLKEPSHLTLSEKREILDKAKSMKYWIKDLISTRCQIYQLVSQYWALPKVMASRFSHYNILKISLKKNAVSNSGKAYCSSIRWSWCFYSKSSQGNNYLCNKLNLIEVY